VGLRALPGRRAFLGEGADPLLRIACGGVHRHHRLREVIRGVLVELDLGVEGLLAVWEHEEPGIAAARIIDIVTGREPEA